MLGSNLRLNSFNISNAAGSFGTGNWLAFRTAALPERQTAGSP